jgi:hypothetical protein
MAAAKKSLLNRIIVTALEANATHPLDNVAFFSNSHPCNVFDSSIGTFDNLFAGSGTEPTAANVKLAAEAFRSIKAPNGQPGGYRLTHILAPGVWEEELRDILETSIVITTTGTSFGATDNRLKGRAKLIISDELSGNFWYPLSLNKPGAYPWCVQDEGIPEEILSDKSSEMYKRTLKVGVAYVVRANGGLALPHCIQRWEGTA